MVVFMSFGKHNPKYNSLAYIQACQSRRPVGFLWSITMPSYSHQRHLETIRRKYRQPKVCPQCKDVFHVHHVHQIYCTKTCLSHHQAEMRKQKRIESILAGTYTSHCKYRFEILKRDGFKCVYCGRSPKEGVILHVDHILPNRKGGRENPENLVTACSECNLGKSDVLLDKRDITKKA